MATRERSPYPAFEAFGLLRMLASPAIAPAATEALVHLLADTRESIDIYGVSVAATRCERHPTLLPFALDVAADSRARLESAGCDVSRHFLPVGEALDVPQTAAALAVSYGALPLRDGERSRLMEHQSAERAHIARSASVETPWTLAAFLRWFQVSVLSDRLIQHRPDLDSTAPIRCFARFLAVNDGLPGPRRNAGSALYLSVMDGLAACSFGDPVSPSAGPRP